MRGYSSGRVKRTVPIPSGMDVGNLIGKKGSNIKDVSARSGAVCRVDGEEMVVLLSGSQREWRDTTPTARPSMFSPLLTCYILYEQGFLYE